MKRTKLIAGREFQLSEPYTPGHVCNEAEAHVLNQVRSENIANNLRAKIKDVSDDEAAALVAAADETYEFTIGAIPARKLDPIEREAQSLARDAIKEHLAKTGRKINSPPDGETDESWTSKIAEQIDKLATRPDIIELARKRLEDKKAAIQATLPGLG